MRKSRRTSSTPELIRGDEAIFSHGFQAKALSHSSGRFLLNGRRSPAENEQPFYIGIRDVSVFAFAGR